MGYRPRQVVFISGRSPHGEHFDQRPKPMIADFVAETTVFDKVGGA